jgi:hypothetical protein
MRSRLAFPALAGLLLIAGLCWMLGSQWGGQDDLLSIVSVVAPLAATVVVCVTTDSPFGELEHSLSHPLVGLRFGQLGALLIVAAATLTGAATAWSGVDVEWQFARNLLGLTGMGLLSVSLLGGRLSWIVPLGFGTLALFLSGSTAGNPPGWAWVVQPAARESATVAALVLLITGFMLVTLRGSRDTQASTDL